MPRYATYGFTRTTISLGPIAVSSGTSQQTIALSMPALARRTLESVTLLPTVAATGTSASRTLNFRKGNASGTVLTAMTIVLADLNTIGTPKTFTATAGSDLTDGDTWTLEIASGGTQFTAGTFIFLLTFRELAQRAA